MGGVLSGYRVLDVTVDKGMFCTRLLADMGADVIRIESSQDTHEQQSASDCYLNTGKRNVTLNLENKEGQSLFSQLASKADVLVEDHAPGYMASRGLGYAELSKTNPRLIMAAITGFGQDGPYRDYKSCDLVLSALSGQMYVCGDSDTPPLKPFGNQTYYTASLYASIGIMLALQERHASGKGQYLDISALECAASTIDHVLVRHFYQNIIARRQGSLHWNNAFRIFPCKDGNILLSLFQQWYTLVALLAGEGMAADLMDKKWTDRKERMEHIDHIINVLENWTKRHNVSELVELGQFMRFPWAEVASLESLLASPQLKERDYFIDMECSGRKGLCPGTAVKLSDSPRRRGLIGE